MDMGKKIVAFALGLFLSGGVWADVGHAAGEAVSTLIAIKGNTFIERDRAERPAKVKDDVLLVDTVTTREAAKAKMLFIDDSVLTLGEKTKVVVKEYVYSKERGGTSIFNLLDGKMKAVVGKAKFEVHTPTAVAAARGTVFLIETGLRNGIPFTDVISLEGEVVVTPVAGPGARGGPEARDSGRRDGASADASGGVVLTPGDFVSVTPGEPLLPPAPPPPAVLGAFLAATESVSFEMPVPSVAELPAPPAVVGGGRAIPARGSASPAALSAPPAALPFTGDPTVLAGSPVGGAGVPPFTQQPPAASTTTKVGVGANFP